eukprot:jgi/Psemu1/322386/estExt_fgenesh1_pg.C_270046
MVQGMAFLSKKGFNPHNNANRKQVWEAQQNSKLEAERIRKRREQLKREQEDEELELAKRGAIGGSLAQLRFMYDAPPDSRSALEKEVGRKNRSGQNNLSYQQQIERFPQLKNAPMAIRRSGDNCNSNDNDNDNDSTAARNNVMVNFKPLGVQILHVRCLACGVWGHAKGDRECSKSGWNPFALPASTTRNGNGNGNGNGNEFGNRNGNRTNTSASSILPSKKQQPSGNNEPSGALEEKKKNEKKKKKKKRHV